jgi:hypothetical protein
MPHLASRHDIVNVRATDVMHECDDYLIYKVSTYRDAARMLRDTHLPGYVSIPIVKSSNQLVLVGTVQRGSLQKSVEKFLKTTVDWEQFGHDSEDAAASPTALLRSGLAAIKKKGGAPRRSYSRVVEGDGFAMGAEQSESGPNDAPSGPKVGGGGSGGTASIAGARERVEDALDTVLQYRDMDSDVVKNPTAIMVDTAPFTLLDTVMFSRGTTLTFAAPLVSLWSQVCQPCCRRLARSVCLLLADESSAVHHYFTMLGLSHAFVTDTNGMLRGVLTKDRLVERITNSTGGVGGPIVRAGVNLETNPKATKQ